MACIPETMEKMVRILMYLILGTHLKGVHMKSIILQSIFAIILLGAALCLMLAYFDVLVK
jgi:hypothetical protein